MFQDPTPQAEIRLIDFGSGTMDTPRTKGEEPKIHTTFAGSAFYISPEMYQRTYTDKTDVWSVGATLYVLVAGYPAEKLQKAFNILQTSKNRNLKGLPNLPEEMPESYYELLEAALTYRHKQRPSASELLKYEFVQFHKEYDESNVLSLDEVAAAAAAASKPASQKAGSVLRTASISLKGSVDRHNLFLGFKKYERSLTALLATMLSKNNLQKLIDILRDRVSGEGDTMAEAAAIAAAVVAAEEGKDDAADLDIQKGQSLSVIKISDLKEILKDEIGSDDILGMMEKLPGASVYDGFAYHVSLLKDFSSKDDVDASTLSHSGRRRVSSKSGRDMRRQNSFSGGRSFTAGGGKTRLLKDDQSSNGSVRSARSFRSNRKPVSNKRSLKTDEKSSNSATQGKMFGPAPKQEVTARNTSVKF